MWRVRSDAMLRRGVTAVCSRPVSVPGEVVDDARGISYRTFGTVLRRNAEYIAERSVPMRLGALDVPALVIFGAADPRWDPDAARLYEATPNTRVERLTDVGTSPSRRTAAYRAAKGALSVRETRSGGSADEVGPACRGRTASWAPPQRPARTASAVVSRSSPSSRSQRVIPIDSRNGTS